MLDIIQVNKSSYPGDLKTRKNAGTGSQIEIHS